MRFVNNSDAAISENKPFKSIDVRSVKGGAALAAHGGRGGSGAAARNGVDSRQ